jgi:hypothetical protein
MRRRLALVLLAAAPMVPTILTAAAPPARAATVINPVLVWTRTYPGVTFRESSPVLANLSAPAVVVGALDGNLYALDVANGTDISGWPVRTTNPINSSPAAADVVGDGHDRIFVGSGQAATTVAAACSGGGTYAFEPDGALRWHNIGSDADCANQAFHSSFAIGDLTGDGLPDATIGALGLQSPSYTAASGVMNKGWPFFTDDTVFSSPALQDVTGSGVPDVIMGGDATAGPGSFRGGMMRAIAGDGHLLWQFNVDEQVRSSPAVGVIDGSGSPSILFGTGNFWQQNGGGTKDSTSLFALDIHGALKWREDLGGVTLGAPALADVGGTGSTDVVEGTFGVGGNTNAGSIWVFDGTGKALPQWAGRVSDGGTVVGGIATADLNGDGAQDLLVPTGAGIAIYDGPSAQEIGTLDFGQVGFQNTPLVTDDGGGAVGITVAGTQPDGTGVIQHWRVPGAQLGTIGWPMFRHDPRHTGNLATAAAPLVCHATSSSPAPTGKVARLFGDGRNATAIAASKAKFPANGSAKAVVLASNSNYPDALAGAPLAVSRAGPLLITVPSTLEAPVKAEISRVLPIASTVYVMGGGNALSPSIDTNLETMGYVVKRVAGGDRFGTAVAVADLVGDPGTVFEVTGRDFPDALAAGAAAVGAGGVVLLTSGDTQNPATATYLRAHGGAHYAVGGPASRADPAATAIVGNDRWSTAVDVAQKFFASPPTVGFASGSVFADALAGGPFIASKAGPLLLVPPCGTVAQTVVSFLQGVASKVTTATLFGGAFAVGDDVVGQLDQALG